MNRISTFWISCGTIFFEKTLNLGRYPIKINGNNIPFLTPYDPNEKSEFVLRGKAGELNQEVITKLNATLQLTIRNKQKLSSGDSIDGNGIPHGTFKDTFEGKYDMILEFKFLRDIADNQISTYIQSAFCSISKKKYLSLGSEILSIMSKLFVVYTTIISFIIASLYSYFMKMNFSDIILDELRSFLGARTMYQPGSKYGKILFISVVFMFMFINFFFQSQLNSFITVKKPTALMDSLQDLVENDYDIYGPKGFNQFLLGTYKKQINPVKSLDEFFAILMHHEKVAFMSDCGHVRYNLSKSQQIHIAEENPKYYVILVRDHFCLKKRIASLYIRLLESGISLHNFRLRIETYTDQLERLLLAYTISIDRLFFAFHFLIYGFLTSCVIFFIELYLKH